MRIALAGGGSWWHVFPIQSLVKYIHKTQGDSVSFVWFGEKPSLEYTTWENVRSHGVHIDFRSILSWKWRREKEVGAIIKNILDIVKVKIGTIQSLRGLYTTKCDVIFCKWWYVSLPVVLAWRLLRKKIYLHESDTKPGLSNRICSKFASVIFTGFPWVFPWKEYVVGQILDDDLVSWLWEINNVWEDTNKTHVLVTGWSQWSESVYKALRDTMHENDLSHMVFHIILWTKNSNSKNLFLWMQNIKLYDFVDQKTMWDLLRLCDVSITRGGTTSLAEQQLFGIKKIIIPIPWTHDQLKNAQYYEKNYWDTIIVQDSAILHNILWNTLFKFETFKKNETINPLVAIQECKKTILNTIMNTYSNTSI